jgi:hypothetical protein
MPCQLPDYVLCVILQMEGWAVAEWVVMIR